MGLFLFYYVTLQHPTQFYVCQCICLTERDENLCVAIFDENRYIKLSIWKFCGGKSTNSLILFSHGQKKTLHKLQFQFRLYKDLRAKQQQFLFCCKFSKSCQLNVAPVSYLRSHWMVRERSTSIWHLFEIYYDCLPCRWLLQCTYIQTLSECVTMGIEPVALYLVKLITLNTHTHTQHSGACTCIAHSRAVMECEPVELSWESIVSQIYEGIKKVNTIEWHWQWTPHSSFKYVLFFSPLSFFLSLTTHNEIEAIINSVACFIKQFELKSVVFACKIEMLIFNTAKGKINSNKKNGQMARFNIIIIFYWCCYFLKK